MIAEFRFLRASIKGKAEQEMEIYILEPERETVFS